MRHIALLFALLLLSGCSRDTDLLSAGGNEPFPLQLPPGFPAPVEAEGDPLTLASVQLGKLLFFDTRLSRDGSISCSSCHLPDHAFSDVVALSIGVDGRTGNRNAPTLANVAYHSAFFKDGGVPNLEQQVIAPIHDPVEMDHDIHAAAAALRDQEPYNSLSKKAYGKALDALIITQAIANYERTLISGWSRYDRYLQGDASALDASELRGAQLFNSAELNCTACHQGFDLSDPDYKNVGLYLEYADPGRERISLDPADIGKFKTPTLRNIALTGPYMHDGSLSTLEEVVDHFISGGQAHPNRSEEMRMVELSNDEKVDLIAFLRALTDERSIDQVP